jgi:hypothetical protein
MERRSLRALPFDHVACDRLYERLTSRQLLSQGAMPGESADEIAANEFTAIESDVPIGGVNAGECAILIGEELRRQLDQPAFARRLEARLNLRPAIWLDWTELSDTRQSVLEEISPTGHDQQLKRLVVIEEAWQPPIAEKLEGLRSLRQAAGPDARLIVLLVGRPQGGDVLTPVRPSDLRVWEERLQSLADPRLRVEALIDSSMTNADARRPVSSVRTKDRP